MYADTDALAEAFENVEFNSESYSQLEAFNYLISLMPVTEKKRDIIAGADHDIIYIECDVEELCKIATPEIVQKLSDYGFSYQDDGIVMYV